MLSTPLAIAQLRELADRTPSVFSPAGPYAARLALLGEAMLVVAGVIFVAVLWILCAGLWRKRGADATDGPPLPIDARRWILGGGMLMPVLVLGAVFIGTVGVLGAESHAHEHPAVDVEVIAHQWWWEVRYPGFGITTADEIHIPVQRPVRLTLMSTDVIHSLWLPRLNGKTDLIPGSKNMMFIEASTAGSYRGQCAEYCGLQHAHMALTVVADDSAAFRAWVARQQQPAQAPLDSVQAAGLQAFADHSCQFCHTIRGTAAAGTVAPDLTHIGSRLTIAGGTLPNTPASLGGWIANPDRLKPGVKMPAVPMPGGSLNALVQYLGSLK